ncbi:MAG TPA: NAD(P)-dependent oxidoreductase [Baekduia sp.]|uniref:NAD(P)-dependent oxidoreductase n=1 Tax=Baekduia sp. TaxID=2600305 RepID=UPI002BEADFA6|nr:NAD(P)-dependent oxidoreductase [Baekduia sp.]HMJ35327.1 NAD(P)-dependent oxidoreductase [Baekduia sp.]
MTSVGFLGLGIMGSRMAANLQRAGFAVTAWTHTPGKAEAWAQEHGATAVATPAEAAAGADVVISMVVDGAQVEQILLGEDGAATAAGEGALFVDMSTIAPADARRIGAELAQRSIRFVDAPVTGSSPAAQAGTLTIMAGGGEADVGRAMPLLKVMGRTIVHVGALGHGQTIKLINNAVAAANAATLAQALVMGSATGVDLEALEQILAAGSGSSTMVTLKARPMREHDYTVLFKTEHMLKDVRLCLEEAQAAGVPFPAASGARDALVAAVGRGYADADFSALLEAFEGMAGLRVGED